MGPEHFQQGELHGNKGINLHNFESNQGTERVQEKMDEVASNYQKGHVKISDFKPTQNIQQGHEKDLDKVLVSGDLGPDKFFTYSLENVVDKTHHGNVGTRLGNLESEQMWSHVIDNNRMMEKRCEEANVPANDFKPTQDVEKGKEGNLDSVLVSGNLGNETFLSSTFENQAIIDESRVPGHVHIGNKGTNVSNLSSGDYMDEMTRNFEKVNQNIKDSHIIGDSFKPTLDIFTGRDMKREPTNEQAFKGQSLEETVSSKTERYSRGLIFFFRF